MVKCERCENKSKFTIMHEETPINLCEDCFDDYIKELYIDYD